MMRNRLIAAGLGVIFVAVSLAAHHTLWIDYDVDRSVQLRGVVREINWVNPHVRYFVDVTDSSGQVRTWKVETVAPHVLVRSGIDRTTIQIGDKVIAAGYAGKMSSEFTKQAFYMTRLLLTNGTILNVDPAQSAMPYQPQPAVK